MLRHQAIDRICCIILAVTVLLSILFVGLASGGVIAENTVMGYENRLFDQSRVHTIDIVMEDWEEFLQTATSEEYAACHLVIDGESYKNVAIRAKGNTSLSSVRSYGNDRYSFKVEFDHYQSGATYHGLDKLSLNNLIQDNTLMKDYLSYTLMGKMGVAAPLCSYVQILVNGEFWGLYLAVEGVEDSFLQRNYGKDHGELYKPDSMSFGGGRGNGGDFDMDALMEQFDFSFGGRDAESAAPQAAMQPPARNGGGNMGGAGNPWGMPSPGDMPEIPSADNASEGPAAGNAPGGFSFGNGRQPAMPGGMQTPENFNIPQRENNGMMGRDFGNSDVKLQYAGDDPGSYSSIFGSAKTDISEADQARLIAALKAMDEGDLSAVNQDAVIRYMAVHHFLCNDDSYTGSMVHNYYLYEENGVLEIIPWDYNLAFGSFGGFGSSSNATSIVNREIDQLVSTGGGDRPLADWILASEETAARYYAVYAQFIEEIFESGWFDAEMSRVIDLISPYVERDTNGFCTYEQFREGTEALRAFCRKRAQSIRNQLNGDSTLVDASDVNISAMGSMRFGGNQGGWDRPDRNSNEQRGEWTAGGQRNGFQTPGREGQSAGEQRNPGERNTPEEESQAQITPSDRTDAASMQSITPAFDRSSFSWIGASRTAQASNQWMWLAACCGLLLAALIFAVCYKSKR